MKKVWKLFPWFLIGIISITLVLLVIQANKLLEIPKIILLIFRLLSVAALVVYAFRKKSLTTWILVCMVAGAEFGYDVPAVAKKLQVLSDVFLRLIKTIIAPLLFSTLVVGIAGHADIKQIGRMGWKSLLYFEIVSTLALFIGLLAINLGKAGVGVVLPPNPEVPAISTIKAQSTSDFILHIFPENIAKAIFEGQILQIVIFSIIFAIAVAMVKEKYRIPMIRFSESLAEVMFKFTNIVMYFAPVAVFAAIAYTVGHMGLDILYNLFKLLATLYVALIVFLLFVLFPIALIFKIPVRPFIRAVSEPATIAFATSNSESALPSAMESMEKFGIPRKIVAFVIPTGYSFNLDGTTLYLSLASIFVAQAAGIDLPVGKQLLICFTLMLTSKGVAGVSRA
jgi:proton glutamate symport protein